MSLTQYIKEPGSPLQSKLLPSKVKETKTDKRLTLCPVRAICWHNSINLPNYSKWEVYCYLPARWGTRPVCPSEGEQQKSGYSGSLSIALGVYLKYTPWGVEMGRADDITVKLTCHFPRRCVWAQLCCLSCPHAASLCWSGERKPQSLLSSVTQTWLWFLVPRWELCKTRMSFKLL